MNVQSIQIKPVGSFEMAETAAVNTLPANMRNDPYNYVHYPSAWAWHDRHGFIPKLSEITHKAGANGVAEKVINGKVVGVDVNLAWAGSMQKGGMIVRPDDARLGKWRGFLKKTPCDGGGFRYSFVGSTYTRLPNNTVNIGEVGEPYADFLAHLRDNGLVHPIDEAAARMLIEQERSLLDKTIERAGGSNHPVHLKRATEIEAKIARMTAELDRIRATLVEAASPEATVAASDDASVPMPEITIGKAAR